MNQIVYWSRINKRGTWHLYKDCPKFLCPPPFQKSGSVQAALDAGCDTLCPVCRARYEKEHAASPSAEGKESGTETTAVVAAPPSFPPLPSLRTETKKRLLAAVIGAAAVLILSSLYYNGKFESDLESARQQGYDAGYSEGIQSGYNNGYEIGYAEGSDISYTQGYTEGTADGYDTGYLEGKDSGYAAGHEDGYAEGLEEGSSQGYDKGYADGKQAAATASASGSSGEKSASAPSVQETSVTVYITATGAKYHRAGCSYLKKSSIAISLSDAKAQGYTACSRCNPPS